MLSSFSKTDYWYEKKYPNVYVTCIIGMATNTNQYQVMNDFGYWLLIVNGKIQINQNSIQ